MSPWRKADKLTLKMYQDHAVIYFYTHASELAVDPRLSGGGTRPAPGLDVGRGVRGRKLLVQHVDGSAASVPMTEIRQQWSVVGKPQGEEESRVLRGVQGASARPRRGDERDRPSQGHKGLQSTNGGGERVDKGV